MLFKNADDIFSDMKTELEADPQFPLDLNKRQSIARSFLKIVAAATSLLWDKIKQLYLILWPQYSDLPTLRRWYELWGKTWDDPDIDTARSTVLAFYRQQGVGTIDWYKQVTLSQFKDDVSEAVVVVRARGPNTVDITVSNHGQSVWDSVVDSIQDFFDAAAQDVAGAEVLIKSI